MTIFILYKIYIGLFITGFEAYICFLEENKLMQSQFVDNHTNKPIT